MIPWTKAAAGLLLQQYPTLRRQTTGGFLTFLIIKWCRLGQAAALHHELYAGSAANLAL